MHLCCHCRECCSSWASENEFPWFNRYFTEMNSVYKYYNIQFLKIQLSYQDSYLLSLQFWDCYVSGTWRVVLCRDPWTPVIAGVVRGDTRRRSRWNLARLGICTPCKLKGPILFRYLGFCGFYTACAEAVGQIDLFYGTDTHYDKNCWVYGEVSWLSARGSFWKHHIMTKNSVFEAPGQSPSGGKKNLDSICPRKKFLWRMGQHSCK